MALRSRIVEVEEDSDPFEICYQRGWTDGMPIVPPTEEKVAAMLDYLGRDPAEVIGVIAPKNGIATMEKVVANCVMAGCLPDYVPVVLAAFEVMLEESFNLNGVEATQGNCEPLVIVGGPAVERLGFNCGEGVFGGGSRANATVGRAVRLILWNIGGSIPGEIAKAPTSHPGRYSFCVAENQPSSPWPPLHTEWGISAEASAVTVMACNPPFHFHFGGTHAPPTVRDILGITADAFTRMGLHQMKFLPEGLLVLGRAAAHCLADQGWSRDDVRRRVFELAHRPLRELARGWYDPAVGNVRWPRWIDQTSLDTSVPALRSPDQLRILVTGGERGGAWCQGWHFTQAQARAIQWPTSPNPPLPTGREGGSR